MIEDGKSRAPKAAGGGSRAHAPYPFADESVDRIHAWHVFEHLADWWGAFVECARLLKVGGVLEVRVPDESSGSALTYRDHYHVFSRRSFHGAYDVRGAMRHGTNAWAREEAGTVPLAMTEYYQVPFRQYEWLTRWPRVLRFCADHLRNFIWEQRFVFVKFEGRQRHG